MAYTGLLVAQINLVCWTCMVLSLLVIRRWPPSLPVERWTGGLGVLIWLAAELYYVLEVDQDLATNLPLHICDLSALAGVFTLLTGWRFFQALFHFMAGFAIVPLFVPMGEFALDDPAFWFFWLSHISIVVLFFYQVLIKGFRPRRREYVGAVLGLSLYFALILSLNLMLGWNYNHIGRAGLPFSLGGFPWQALWLFIFGNLILLGMWALSLLPGGRRSENL